MLNDISKIVMPSIHVTFLLQEVEEEEEDVVEGEEVPYQEEEVHPECWAQTLQGEVVSCPSVEVLVAWVLQDLLKEGVLEGEVALLPAWLVPCPA